MNIEKFIVEIKEYCMYKKVLELFEKTENKHFWGNYFDSRFYIAMVLDKISTKTILDIGCGGGILLHLSKAQLKIGLDYSFESLLHAKKLDKKMELVCGDAAHLPFRTDFFPTVLAIHILPELKKIGGDWETALNELKRVSKTNSTLIIVGANRMSRHFENYEIRKEYLNYKQQLKLLEDEFLIDVNGFDPHSKLLMYPLKKIFLNLPEKILNGFLEKKIFEWLKSKRYLKNGRSYVMIYKKKS